MTKEIENQTDEEVEYIAESEMLAEEYMSKLTDLEKKYCQILVWQNPKTKVEAMRKAGSTAQPQYLSKMANEIENRPHVRAYITHLRGFMAKEAGLTIQEIINNARKAIEMAFELGKPKDADPHNRLLAELGGFIKNTVPAPHSLTQIKVENQLRGEDVAADFKKLTQLAGLIRSE